MPGSLSLVEDGRLRGNINMQNEAQVPRSRAVAALVMVGLSGKLEGSWTDEH